MILRGCLWRGDINGIEPCVILLRHLTELRGRDVGTISGPGEPGSRVRNGARSIRLFRDIDLEEKSAVHHLKGLDQARSAKGFLASHEYGSLAGLTIGPGTGPPASKLGTIQRTAGAGVSE